jgi:hypothetical protein
MKSLIFRYFEVKVMLSTKTSLCAPLSQGKITSYHDSMLSGMKHLHNNTVNKVAHSTEE